MSYTAITEISSPNYTPGDSVAAVFGGTPRRIESITIHHWGNLGQRFDDVVRFLCTADNGRQSSAHYVAEAGKVACIVAPADAAWHAGNAYGNATSVGIECRPEASQADYETVAELIAELRAVYGDLPLIPHNQWTNTACPGAWDLGKLDAMARGNAVQVQEAPAPVAPAPAPAAYNGYDSGLRWIVDPGDTLGAIAAHYGIDVNALAAYNGIDPNRINVGQSIIIPGPLVWIVEPGDTLGAIAAYYALDVATVAARNGIEDYNLINVGDVLTIG